MLEKQAEAVANYIGANRYMLVGSTYILGDGNDLDYLYLVPNTAEAYEFLNRKGFVPSSDYGIDGWFSVKREFDGKVLNCLVTNDEEFFIGFANAADVCKYLYSIGVDQMRQKAVRVAVHKIVRDSFTIEGLAGTHNAGTTTEGKRPMSTLQPHQQRVVDEKNELSERLSKLLSFFQDPIFQTLSEAERSRQRNQARFMDGYAAVLEERIAAFGA